MFDCGFYGKIYEIRVLAGLRLHIVWNFSCILVLVWKQNFKPDIIFFDRCVCPVW
jgi:hypothetical protein